MLKERQLSSKLLKTTHCTRSNDRPVLSCHKTNEHRNLKAVLTPAHFLLSPLGFLHNGQWTLQKHLNELLNCPTAVFINYSCTHTHTRRNLQSCALQRHPLILPSHTSIIYPSPSPAFWHFLCDYDTCLCGVTMLDSAVKRHSNRVEPTWIKYTGTSNRFDFRSCLGRMHANKTNVN